VSAALEHTLAHIARVGRALERRLAAGGLDAAPIPVEDPPDEAPGEDAPIALLTRRFELHPIERDTLVLALAIELDERVARGLGALRGGTRHGFVDAQLALALLAPDPFTAAAAATAFDASGALFRAGLLRAVPVTGFAPYRAAECLVPERHVLFLAQGRRALGGDVEAVAERVVSSLRGADLPGLAPLVAQLATTLRGYHRQPRVLPPDEAAVAAEGPARYDYERGLVLEVTGPAGSGRRMLVRAAAGTIGRALIEVDARVLGGHPDWSERLRQVFQQAELYGEIVHLRRASALTAGAQAELVRLVARHAVALVLSHDGTAPLSELGEHVVARVRTPPQLTRDTAARLWEQALPARTEALDPHVFSRLAEGHPLSARQVRQAVRLATAWSSELRQPGAPVVLAPMVLQGAASAQRAAGPSVLTTEVTAPTRRLDDLVMATDKRAEIQNIVDACAHRREVLHVWGLDRVLTRGTGIICLFDGPPGTGKTLTAEVLAAELGLELQQINVGRVVDKYIGETEKNLEQLFAQAIPERTMLLFDEADSLFGTRVKVSSSTDRYANMAINTLLQLIERYPGVVILTTNLKEALDPAFERRITYKVTFERPDRDARHALWRAHLPAEAPLAGDVDLWALSELELSPGHIKNAVLRAALASAKSGRITQAALREQAEREAKSVGVLVRRTT